MSNENRDEFAGWAGRLEEPGALSGAGLKDKGAAWDKLHSRLSESKKPVAGLFTRRRFWLGAAACLLFLLIPALYLHRGKPVSGAVNATAGLKISESASGLPGESAATSPPGPSRGLSSDNGSPDHYIYIRNGIPAQAKRSGLSKTSGSFARSSSDTDLVYEGVMPSLPEAAMTNAVQIIPAPTTIPLTALQPLINPAHAARRALPVVSANEIDGGEQPENERDRRPPGRVRIHLGNQWSIRPSMAIQEQEEPSFIIKLSDQKP